MANSNPTFVNDMNLFGNHIKQIPCIVGEGSPTSDTYGAVGMLWRLERRESCRKP